MRSWEGARGIVVVLAAGWLVVAVVASFGAIAAYGRPVAGALVDASGQLSNVGPSDWDAKRQGFGFPDQVVSVDGVTLDPAPGVIAREWDAAVAGAAAAGRTHVTVTIRTRAGPREARFALHRLRGAAWWLFAAMSIFTGILWSGTGLVALWVGPSSALARATAQVGLAVGLFMLTLSDIHTTRVMVPLFWLAFGTVPVALAMLALRLPDDAPVLRRFPWLEWVGNAASLALAAALIFRHATGLSTASLQVVAGSLLGAGLLFFAGVFVLRLVRARGQRRVTMRTLAVAMVPPYGVAALFALFSSLGEWRYGDLLIYPMLGLAPVATVYAVVRFDIWQSRAVLSRVLIRIAVASLVWLLATAAGAGVAVALGLDARFGALAAGVAALAATGAMALFIELSDRVFFTAEAAYKPTVARLSAELTNTTSPAEVAVAMERTLQRWLGCDRVALRFVAPGPVTDVSGEWPLDGGRGDGTPTADGGRRLEVSFGGVPLAELEVGPKPGSALYTTMDLELLATIADQGGVALAHAFAYQELERRRREQAQAFREERAALVETVAGEIAHEIRHPINFFRSVFDAADIAGPLDDEDVEVGREEVARLERLVSGLRRLTGAPIERHAFELAAIGERVERLLRDALDGRRLELDIPRGLRLRCDHDKVIQVLVNLVSNALEASPADGAVGLRWRSRRGGGQLVVWDEGSGFEGDPARLFAPWHTTKKHGTGLGLAITYRLVRAHDWMVRAERKGNQTHFVVDVRAEDIVLDADESHNEEVA